MRVAAGYRRYVVDVQEHDGSTLDGQPTYYDDNHWLTIMRQVPVEYLGKAGSESIRGQHIEADSVGTITMLSTPRSRRIHAGMRFVMGNRKLYITSSFDQLGRNEDLIIQVKEQQ